MQKARSHHKMAPTACKRMVSGSISLSYSEYFSPFPHGTCSLSVSHQYLALPDGPGKFRQDFTCPALLRILLVNKSISNTGLSPTMVVLSKTFFYKFILHVVVLQPQNYRNNLGLGCSLFVRHYSGNHYCFLFLWLLRCFSSPGQLPINRIIILQIIGLPHSEIFDSKVICTLSKLIAACHVLHSL